MEKQQTATNETIIPKIKADSFQELPSDKVEQAKRILQDSKNLNYTLAATIDRTNKAENLIALDGHIRACMQQTGYEDADIALTSAALHKHNIASQGNGEKAANTFNAAREIALGTNPSAEDIKQAEHFNQRYNDIQPLYIKHADAIEKATIETKDCIASFQP